MKKLLFGTAIFSTLLLAACSNEFDVTANWKDVPVVYGMLDLSDSAQYIRVERAFLPQEGDALEFAKNPDSVFYQDATVQLERISNGQLFNLDRVDGNSWGFPREDGTFPTAPNWLYRIDSSELLLKPSEAYRLRIDRGGGLPEVTGRALVLPQMVMQQPSGNGFAFQTNTVAVSWDAPDSATIFDVNLLIKYAEYPATNPADLTHKSIEWNWVRGLRRETSENTFIVNKAGVEFYELLKNKIEVDENLKRIFVGIDIEIIAGGEAVEDYINVSSANTGITASQDLPSYSNLSEGRGVFSSIVKLRRFNVGLTENARKELKEGDLTKNLNF